tara:strand:- start:2410 stop:3627 length:1218 start_codon:yes stop_codon:yes gene_type:complete
MKIIEVIKIGNLNIKTFKGLNVKNKSNKGKYRLIPSGANFPKKIKLEKCKYFDEISEKQKNKKLLKNDILFNTGGVGTLGRSSIYSEDIIDSFSDGFILTLRVLDQKILPKMLFYFFQSNSINNEIIKNTRGTTGITSIRTDNILSFKIPIFQIEEQKRIVERLDICMKQIDKAIHNLELNIHNAEELFQGQLNEIFSKKGNGWEENKLKDITSKIGSGATPRGGKASYKKSGISLIRSLNVYDEGFKEGKLAFIDEEQAEKLNNVQIEEGDILFNITGASVARCCIAPKEYLPARVNQHVSIIRLISNYVNKEFLHYCLISKVNKDKLLGIGGLGATRQAITKAQLEDFIVSYPKNLSEQVIIVDKLNKKKIQSLKLKSNYQQELQSLNELKKSILEKAFNGEL